MPISTIFPALNLALGLLAFVSIWLVVGKVRGTINSLAWSLIMVSSLVFALKYLLILLKELALIDLIIDVEIADLLIVLLILMAGLKLNRELSKLIKRQ